MNMRTMSMHVCQSGGVGLTMLMVLMVLVVMTPAAKMGGLFWVDVPGRRAIACMHANLTADNMQACMHASMLTL